MTFVFSQLAAWYLQSVTDDHQGNIFPNSIDEEFELNRTQTLRPTFTDVEPNTNLIFKSTQNPNRIESLSSNNPNRTRTQISGFFSISSLKCAVPALHAVAYRARVHRVFLNDILPFYHQKYN